MPSPTPHAALPWFVRRLWVSDKACSTWEPFFREFSACWRQLEWLTVADRTRPCATFFVSQKELAALASLLKDYGLAATTLATDVCNVPGSQDEMLRYRAAVGRRRDLRELEWAWKCGHDEAIGQLLGYPACCRAHYSSVAAADQFDGLWPMALQTASADEALAKPNDREFPQRPETNPFWRTVGVQLTPHEPCRFDCAESIALARQFVECGRSAGYSGVMDRALELLSWPVEWSALNGIAEIRTPIVKICQATQTAYEPRTVHLRSQTYPELGARPLYARLTGTPLPGGKPAATQVAPVGTGSSA